MSSTNGARPKSNSTQEASSGKASVDDLTQRNVELIRHLSAKQERTRSDLVAEAIANFCGSMTFVWVHVVWFGAWVVINVAPGIPCMSTSAKRWKVSNATRATIAFTRSKSNSDCPMS
jgi:hypothetical protein